MEALQIENLSFTYPGASKPALSSIRLCLPRGSYTVLIGASGSGKSTLLHLLKPEIAPYGQRTGTFFIFGEKDKCMPGRVALIGQDPDAQIVTDKVWHELAFGPESLGMPHEVIHRRVAEMACYFGMQQWYHADTDTLSGGQKQQLSLAAAMVMQPELLLLDEPTAQLDPIAATEFLATLRRLNQDFGITILLAEHRLEEVLSVADRVLVLEDGRLLCNDTPRQVCARLAEHTLFCELPAAARIWARTKKQGACPLTVRQGKEYLAAVCPDVNLMQSCAPEPSRTVKKNLAMAGNGATEPVLEARNIWFRYEKQEKDVLRDFSLCLRRGEILSVLGGNGCGKTTMLQVLAGLDRPYRGSCCVYGKKMGAYGSALYRGILAMLPQNPKNVFLQSSIQADFDTYLTAAGIPKEQHAERIAAQVQQFEIAELLVKHPYDLSGGETQRCALAKLLLLHPQILLLDEPTKGMDGTAKEHLGTMLQRLRTQGVTVLLVTHDIEFAASFSDRCALFFDGCLDSCDTPHAFFANNTFYTTVAHRIARDLFPHAILCSEVIQHCHFAGVENKK